MQILSALLLMSTLVSTLAYANPPLPREGLVMHLDASVGVETQGQTINNWWDQSGYNQDLKATGSPKLISAALNGLPVIELDQGIDRLRQTKNSTLPTLDNDRTLIFLSAATNANTNIGYGGNSCGSAFGMAQDPEGYSRLALGCDDAHMYAQGKIPAGAWNLHALILSAGTLIHLRNGELVDGRTPRFKTENGAFEILTPNLRRASKGNLRVATVLGYNRALGSQELRALQRYVGNKWFNNNNHFQSPPNLRRLEFPEPQMELTRTQGDKQRIELAWRVSFAEECRPDTNWTNSNATSGLAVVRNSQPGASYRLNCWHSSASASAAFPADTKPLKITWHAPADQQNAITGYRLFLGERSKRYDTIVQLAANQTNSHTFELPPGDYYVAMSSIGTRGRESGLSGEMVINIR